MLPLGKLPQSTLSENRALPSFLEHMPSGNLLPGFLDLPVYLELFQVREEESMEWLFKDAHIYINELLSMNRKKSIIPQ